LDTEEPQSNINRREVSIVVGNTSFETCNYNFVQLIQIFNFNEVLFFFLALETLATSLDKSKEFSTTTPYSLKAYLDGKQSITDNSASQIVIRKPSMFHII